MKLIRIEQNCVEVTWPYVKHFIKKPLDRGMNERDIDDIYLSLLHNQMQLWVLASEEEEGMLGACITQLIQYPKYRALSLPLVGTKPHTISKWYEYTMDDNSPLMPWGKEQGAVRLECYVRDGWLKYTKKFNFKKYYTTIVKEIE